MTQTVVLAVGQTAADSSDVVVAPVSPVTLAIYNQALATPTNAAFATASTGGTLVPATYYYRVSAINAVGETLASTEASQVVGAGTSTNTVTVNWLAVTGATGYKVYGRSTGAELLIATVGAVLTYVDTGAVTPAGALPAANTTAGGLPAGAFCTVALKTPGVYPVIGYLSSAKPTMLIEAPGTYIVSRPNVAAFGLNIGVLKESA